jgi:O-antigen/teichoic acid export membrane protein
MAKAYTPDGARLAKNTVLLYFRMFLMMCINLYTSRIVLHTLGVEDYGIYNVVGGVVVMLEFINDSMTASTQRFLSFELGTGNKQKLREVFATSINIHLIISLIIVLLGETVGLWFLHEKMVIPPERMVAAEWCFQLSIFTSVLKVLSYPYISAIIAHEKMSSFAYIAILDAVLKLVLVYLLLVFDYDRLIFFAILYAAEKLFIRMVYNIYCVRNFDECKYRWTFRKDLFKEMASFAGWKMWGELAVAFYTQGLDVLLNVFFGPVINAARAAASYAQIAVGSFASNFQTAINPQIMKTYASEQLKETHQLIFRGSRLTFCLLLTICLPLIVETPAVLGIWLKEVPDGSVTFLRLLLVILMIRQSTSVLVTTVSATGNIKKYETTMGILMLTILPVSYMVLKMGGAPSSVFIVYLAIAVIGYFVSLYIILPLIKLSLRDYIRFSVTRCVLVLLLSFIVPILFKSLMNKSLLFSVLNIILTVICTCGISFVFGLELSERRAIMCKVNTILYRMMNNKKNK